MVLGREREAAEIDALLRAGEAVLLVGPEGIGKTALAAWIAADHPTRWIDAQGAPPPQVGAGSGLLVIDGVDAWLPEHRLALVASLDRWTGPVLMTAQEASSLEVTVVELGPLAPSWGARLLRSGIGDLARAASLDAGGLEALSAVLGGRPADLLAEAAALGTESVASRIVRAQRPAEERQAFDDLERWEGLAAQLDGPDAAEVLGQLQRDAPARERQIADSDPDRALRAAIVSAEVELRAGSASAISERDARLGAGGDPALRATWGRCVAQALDRDGHFAAALERLQEDRPAPGSDGEADHHSMEALLLTHLGRRDEARALRSALLADVPDPPPRVAYRVAVGAFWSGELEEAHRALQIVLRDRGAKGDTLRRLQGLILSGVVGRELGHPSDATLIASSTAEALWREAGHLQQGPQALVLRGTLLADLERWAEAGEAFDEAASLLERLGRPGEAILQRFQRASLLVHSAGLPASLLDPVAGEAGFAPVVRADLDGWRGVVLAVEGAREAARDQLLRAVDALVSHERGERAAELGCFGAAALRAGGDDAVLQTVLERVQGLPDPRGLRALVLGEAASSPPRWEQHLVRDLLSPPVGARVCVDGTWFEGEDGARVDLRRRGSVRRVLAALARAGRPLGADELLEAGWPGEVTVGDSGRRRLEVTLSTLRKLGLEAHLRTLTGSEGTRWQLVAQTVRGEG